MEFQFSSPWTSVCAPALEMLLSPGNGLPREEQRYLVILLLLHSHMNKLLAHCEVFQLCIFPILYTFLCLKVWSWNSAVDFSGRKHLWFWYVCWLQGASRVDTGSLSHTTNSNDQVVGYLLRFKQVEKWSFGLPSLQTFHISRFTWRNPSMGCQDWIYDWRSIYSFGHAHSAACTFPAPKAEERFWTTGECELQPQKIHGRGLVPLLRFLAYSCRKWPWLIYSYLSWV